MGIWKQVATIDKALPDDEKWSETVTEWKQAETDMRKLEHDQFENLKKSFEDFEGMEEFVKADGDPEIVVKKIEDKIEEMLNKKIKKSKPFPWEKIYTKEEEKEEKQENAEEVKPAESAPEKADETENEKT